MKYEANVLLQDIISQKLFSNKNYVIIVGNQYPFWFFFYIKQYLLCHFSIEYILQYSIEDYLQIQKKSINHLFYDGLDVLQKKNMYILYLQKDILLKNKNIFSLFNNDLSYYIIYLHSSDSYLLEDNSFYSLDTVFSGIKKIYLRDFCQYIFDVGLVSLVNYFFEKIYDEFDNSFSLEIFFSMCPFIFLINKKFLYDFVLYFLNNESHYMVYYSLFDLITLFFKKNKDAFYVAWKQLLDQYSIEFLMYFFIEQCIYAQLYVLSFKEKIDDRLEIKKKTNRWFMKHGIKYFSSDEIQDLLFELLLIDSFSKKYQTKILVHLNSFFIQWFQ